jgi:hypothetical protein
MTQYGVVLFPNTSSAIRAEKLMINGGYSVKLIPTPRQFSTDCGVALRFDWTHSDMVKILLEEAKVDIDAVHCLDKKKG